MSEQKGVLYIIACGAGAAPQLNENADPGRPCGQEGEVGRAPHHFVIV
jgi:hypothetical protein